MTMRTLNSRMRQLEAEAKMRAGAGVSSEVDDGVDADNKRKNVQLTRQLLAYDQECKVNVNLIDKEIQNVKRFQQQIRTNRKPVTSPDDDNHCRKISNALLASPKLPPITESRLGGDPPSAASSARPSPRSSLSWSPGVNDASLKRIRERVMMTLENERQQQRSMTDEKHGRSISLGERKKEEWFPAIPGMFPHHPGYISGAAAAAVARPVLTRKRSEPLPQRKSATSIVPKDVFAPSPPPGKPGLPGADLPSYRCRAKTDAAARSTTGRPRAKTLDPVPRGDPPAISRSRAPLPDHANPRSRVSPPNPSPSTTPLAATGPSRRRAVTLDPFTGRDHCATGALAPSPPMRSRASTFDTVPRRIRNLTLSQEALPNFTRQAGWNSQERLVLFPLGGFKMPTGKPLEVHHRSLDKLIAETNSFSL